MIQDLPSLPPDTRVTDERLRCWLDANQLQRERLCAQILPLLGDYSDVAPRRPRGGPDGSRDIQAIFGGTLEVWGAVGFRNGAKDDNADKNWVKKKFRSDLKSALEKNRSLKGFVFLTNVDLTPTEQENLKKYGGSKGVGHVDVFNRERLRLILDGVEGWGYRLQFLDIEMSKEEQSAFISKFGARLESLLEQQRQDIDAKLQRIEFLHDCAKPIRGASFNVYLAQNYTPEELGHFRVLLEVISLHEHDPHPTLWLAARDAYWTHHSQGTETLLFGTKTIAWSRGPDESLQNTVVGGERAGSLIQAFSYLYKRGPFQALGDLDKTTVNVFVTESIVDKVAHVTLTVNDYTLVGAPKDMIATPEQLGIARRDPLVEWPEPLSEEEGEVLWIELSVKGPDFEATAEPERFPFMLRQALPWGIDYDRYTPLKQPIPQ